MTDQIEQIANRAACWALAFGPDGAVAFVVGVAIWPLHF